ncbi:hypothetical protein F8388_015947 [Cannabis sativa]|uniref:Uncharacterized protein n=1 Tax=Cannabis sativa TaxID=3483 RepID=A0A7J6I1Y7_CANSA|nr:hypothetical protein F8388_015947 [Cannabis sativa]KAF4401564.1 hypothetical protein G4B88_001758 [Cannabis sativa]
MTPNSRRHGLIGTNGVLGFPFHFSSMTILALRSKLQKKKAPFSYRCSSFFSRPICGHYKNRKRKDQHFLLGASFSGRSTGTDGQRDALGKVSTSFTNGSQRLRYMPFPTKEEEDAVVILLVWIGLFLSELWFTLYWLVTLVVRWNPVYRHTFKDRLIHKYGEKDLPGVDIFVCTTDPKAEPPLMVVNTVLSVMAYDYPPHKLSVYLSDDGASELTFYALLEASEFSKKWLPFCNKFKVEPRSLEAYFTNNEASQPLDDHHGQWASIKVYYIYM